MQRGALVKVSKCRTGVGVGQRQGQGGDDVLLTSEKALVSLRERSLEALCRAAACPARAPSEVFISTCCFGGAFVAFLLLGQNTWEKLVKEDGAYFVSQLASAALCGRKVGASV